MSENRWQFVQQHLGQRDDVLLNRERVELLSWDGGVTIVTQDTEDDDGRDQVTLTEDTVKRLLYFLLTRKEGAT